MNILIIDKVHHVLPQLLSENGHDVLIDLAKGYSYYLDKISGFDGIIIRSGIQIDKAFIDKASKLKFIARVGAGMENIEVDYAQQKGIKCINSPEGNRTAVGEQALAMLLSLFNNLKRADTEVRKGIWNREANRGVELEGMTVGIVGYGNMGSAFAKRLVGFGVEVVAYDKYKTGYSDRYVQEASMEYLFAQCDVVSLHLPLNKETKYLVDSDWLGKFEKQIYLINTARGPIVRTQDLVKAIDESKVLGACLDVLEYEELGFENIDIDKFPKAFHYLRNSNKVILSPHIAGWTQQSNYKLSKVIADKILSFNNGKNRNIK